MLSTRTNRIVVLVVLVLLVIGVWSYPSLLGSARAGDAWVAGVSGRTNLQLCVADLRGSAMTDEVMSKIQTTFAKVKKHPDFEQAGLNRGDGPEIRAGCPSAATLNTQEWGRNTVTTPGSIQTYVFSASEQDFQQTTFKSYPRVVGQEQMCVDSQCASVANAVYLTTKELNDPALLIRALTVGIGLSDSQSTAPLYNDQVTPDDKSKK